MPQVLTLLATVGGYFGLHLFMWFSVTRLFGVTSSAARLGLLLAAIALALSFPLSAVLARVTDGQLSNFAYAFAAAWIGLLVYLTAAFAAAWGAYWLMRHAGVTQPSLLVAPAIVAVVTALTVTAFAVLAAFRPVVTDVTVPMKNLPPEWADRTIIQLSDVHLGTINGQRYAERLVGQVNALRPDVILITGDLFDGMTSDPAQFIPILNGLRAKYGVFYVTGNHEHYLGIDKALATLKSSTFRVLDNERIDVDGLQIVGLAFPGLDGGSYPTDIITSRPGYDRSMPTVLLYHEPINVNHQSAGGAAARSAMYFAPNTDYSTQRDSGVDLQLSGHTHAGQFFPFTLVAHAVWRGFDYGLHDDGDFWLYVTSGTGTWGPPLRLGTKSEIVRLHLTARP